MIAIAIITLLIFLVIGVPVSFAIGLSGLLAILLGSDVPPFVAVQQAIRGMNSFSLMAGPLFILAGGYFRLRRCYHERSQHTYCP